MLRRCERHRKVTKVSEDPYLGMMEAFGTQMAFVLKSKLA